jgi:GNAT superfamily N-acetyltransferase
MRIRAALAGECAALTALAHSAKRHWSYPEADIRAWRDELTVTPASLRDDVVEVALEADAIVGFYALAGAGGTLELEHFWVTPGHMRRGIGRRMFEHALHAARLRGGTVLRIASDPNAEGFYRRMGARRVGEVPSTPAGRVLPLLEIDLT